MGIPLGAVEQALQKEGKDKSIASMDPEKSYDKQIAKKEHANHDHAEVPLKDDPEYAKFFKVRCCCNICRNLSFIVANMLFLL